MMRRSSAHPSDALAMESRRALAELFGEPVHQVRIIERSWYARLHGRAVATTRRNRIYLRGTELSFFRDHELVLHEYFHVLRQWGTEDLTIARYLVECCRRGYYANRFEVEARRFAADQLSRFRALINRAMLRDDTGDRPRT